MQGVTWMERAAKTSPIPERLRPVVGGLILIPIAWMSPQALSAGHGALHLDLTEQVGLGFLVTVFLLKIIASTVSLGFGFRGGLFFASLFLGSLVGQIYAGLAALFPALPPIDATDAALVGMAALAVAVVGGPMTMSMLVLETTHDFALTGAALAAALCASTVVRETFGFSFSTWRLHTRGETIRSARDVGWVKTLTAGRMMRRGVPVVAADTGIGEFRRRFPLGSTGRVVLTDLNQVYAGLVPTAAAFADDLEEAAPVSSIAILDDVALRPDQDVTEVMRVLDEREADDLAVVDAEGHVLGILSEKHVHRRYAEEIEKAQRDLFGET
jgi:CIC family chloride channel protein